MTKAEIEEIRERWKGSPVRWGENFGERQVYLEESDQWTICEAPYDIAKLLAEIDRCHELIRKLNPKNAWEDGYGLGWDDAKSGEEDPNKRPNPYTEASDGE